MATCTTVSYTHLAWKAQRDWAANYKIEDRQRIIEAIRRCARAHVEEWCHKIAVSYTHLDVYKRQAQGSMAYCEQYIADKFGKVVLSSPRFGAAELKKALEKKGTI